MDENEQRLRQAVMAGNEARMELLRIERQRLVEGRRALVGKCFLSEVDIGAGSMREFALVRSVDECGELHGVIAVLSEGGVVEVREGYLYCVAEDSADIASGWSEVPRQRLTDALAGELARIVGGGE